MKKFNEGGFALLTVLIFMQVFALLGLTALETAFWQEKLVAQERARRVVMNQVDKIYKLVETQLDFSNSSCLVPRAALSQWLARPLNWWKDHACGDDKAYYALEFLDQDPCAFIPNAEAEPAYYRISVLVIDPEETRQVFQVTLVRPSPPTGHCEAERHSVDLGLQSWREIE